MKHTLALFAAFFLLTVGLLAAGCGSGGRDADGYALQSTPLAALALDTDTTLQVGETRRIASTQTALTFASVEEDSRCPIDANCVTAGTFRAKLYVVSGGVTSVDTVVLSQPPGSVVIPATQNRPAYTVSLRAITPDRQSNLTIAPTDYKITIQVSPSTEAQ